MILTTNKFIKEIRKEILALNCGHRLLLNRDFWNEKDLDLFLSLFKDKLKEKSFIHRIIKKIKRD